MTERGLISLAFSVANQGFLEQRSAIYKPGSAASSLVNNAGSNQPPVKFVTSVGRFRSGALSSASVCKTCFTNLRPTKASRGSSSSSQRWTAAHGIR